MGRGPQNGPQETTQAHQGRSMTFRDSSSWVRLSDSGRHHPDAVTGEEKGWAAEPGRNHGRGNA